ncbi:hypothetical protein DERP_003637 [Dermatophagoides pteronyssinus]|uniref:Uncharacterized protein n=1 Tax=Dermatophagoides pteronyssinus TaxID=6956 RepID=A0ABQ8JL80_DERPT|nr:hypothetical protein DERP_003637 [Dermatophagoides pteronyssinus]
MDVTINASPGSKRCIGSHDDEVDDGVKFVGLKLPVEKNEFRFVKLWVWGWLETKEPKPKI